MRQLLGRQTPYHREDRQRKGKWEEGIHGAPGSQTIPSFADRKGRTEAAKARQDMAATLPFRRTNVGVACDREGAVVLIRDISPVDAYAPAVSLCSPMYGQDARPGAPIPSVRPFPGLPTPKAEAATPSAALTSKIRALLGARRVSQALYLSNYRGSAACWFAFEALSPRRARACAAAARDDAFRPLQHPPPLPTEKNGADTSRASQDGGLEN